MFDVTIEKCKGIMLAKNNDYSHGEDPFVNFRASEILGVPIEKGILVRVLDKIQRIRTFSDTGKLAVSNESVDDAIDDIINYMILLKGVIYDKIQAK